jgi:hypothetical protein
MWIQIMKNKVAIIKNNKIYFGFNKFIRKIN